MRTALPLALAASLLACSGTESARKSSTVSTSSSGSTGSTGSTASSTGSSSSGASTASSSSSSASSSAASSSGSGTTGSSGSSTGSTGSTGGGNDDTCAGATPLVVGASVSGDTSTAADDYHAAGCPDGSSHGRDRVYALTPVASGSYTFHVGFLGFDAELYLLDACPPALAASGELASCPAVADAHASTTAEDLPVSLNAGTTYYLVVDSWTSGPGGTFELSVTGP